MILFVGQYPDSTNEKDGSIQRMAAIDKFFAGRKRLYLDIRYRDNFSRTILKPSEEVTVYKLNLFLHLFTILSIGLRADFIYVHTVYNALKALPLYFFKSIVTDMHGVVPEEMNFEGKKLKSLILSLVERIALPRSTKIVCVTRAMAQYFKNKYKGKAPKVAIIPIFDEGQFGPKDSSVEEERNSLMGRKPVIIYSGGLQRWQNVELMLDAISRLGNRYEYEILSGDQEAFEAKLVEAGLTDFVKLDSVPKEAVYEYYRNADFGFVLREDNLVNRVACPTKLIEYLSCGVIPIVLQPQIGDFAEYGYSYVLLEDLLAGKIPSLDEIEVMRATNFRVIKGMKEQVACSIAEIQNTFFK